MNKDDLYSSFEIKGEWFLPDNKEQRLFGILTFNPNLGIKLELNGDFKEANLLKGREEDFNIILGITSDNKKITLYRCSETSHSKNFGENRIVELTNYTALYMFKGIHAFCKEELMFNKISARIFNLDEWLGIFGLSKYTMPSEENEYTIDINYKLPSKIKFDIDIATIGYFDFTINYPLMLGAFSRQLHLNQYAQIVFEFQKELNIFEILDYILDFQRFLTFAFYDATSIKAIKLASERYLDEYEPNKYARIPIEIFYKPDSNNSVELKNTMFMLFSYKNIQTEFPFIIKKWYANKKVLGACLDLVFDQLHNKRFSENTFLNLAQAAETFHARLYNHTKMARADYKKMKDDILSISPPQYHDWLNNQFNFGNNLNLHNRLSELIDKYSNPIIDRMIPNKYLFMKQIKDSRNYYTHYSKTLEKKALKGRELNYLTKKLQILLVCAFLMESGVAQATLTQSLDRLKYTHFYYLAEW